MTKWIDWYKSQVKSGWADEGIGPFRHDHRTPEGHAAQIANEAFELISAKYAAGQIEHGGQLWRKHGIVDMAIDEAVDQVIYLLTLRDQIAAAGVILGDLSE